MKNLQTILVLILIVAAVVSSWYGEWFYTVLSVAGLGIVQYIYNRSLRNKLDKLENDLKREQSMHRKY